MDKRVWRTEKSETQTIEEERNESNWMTEKNENQKFSVESEVPDDDFGGLDRTIRTYGKRLQHKS